MSQASPGTYVQIGAVADATGLSLRTLRHYDDVGLVRPSGRSEGGFRLYSSADIDQLLVIRRMKPLGFSLEEMAALLAALGSPSSSTCSGDRPDPVEELLAEARRRRADLAEKLQMADEFIHLLSERAPRAATPD